MQRLHGEDGRAGEATRMLDIDLLRHGIRGSGILQIADGSSSSQTWKWYPEESTESVEENGSSVERSTKISGPIQFLSKLLELWDLDRSDAVGLLGFDPTESEYVARALEGTGRFHGRDVRDRISHLFWIRTSLRSLFRDLKVENEWLRESHSMLDDKSPLSLLLEGSMDDLLLVREYVDTIAGR